MNNIANTYTKETNESLALRILVKCVDPAHNAADLPSILMGIKAALDEKSLMEERGDTTESKTFFRLKADPEIISKTVFDDYIICLEDNVKLKSLKRYLKARHHITFDEYKEKWSLPNYYPSVCKSYSKRRSTIAKDIGLGKSRTKKDKDISDVYVVKSKPVQISLGE